MGCNPTWDCFYWTYRPASMGGRGIATFARQKPCVPAPCRPVAPPGRPSPHRIGRTEIADLLLRGRRSSPQPRSRRRPSSRAATVGCANPQPRPRLHPAARTGRPLSPYEPSSLLHLPGPVLIRIMINSCAPLVILSAAKDLGCGREKRLVRWPDPSASPQDDRVHAAQGFFRIRIIPADSTTSD
jgi:hypothetical protein